MNDNERILLNYVCSGDIRNAQKQARVIVDGITSQKDMKFKDDMIRKLDSSSAKLVELPYNVRELLIAEDVTDFPVNRFLLSQQEAETVKKLLKIYRASEVLAQKRIPYYASLILHGDSGTGKTMLARYIAHEAKLPFVYVRFSSLVNQYLGGTQSNISKVFDYVRTSPCVLCFDEIDAIGIKRGDRNDVSEMSRVVIALMQEMDRLPNNVIVVGTTNRFDRIDPALMRRFTLALYVEKLNLDEAILLSDMFFCDVGVIPPDGAYKWASEKFFRTEKLTASQVVSACTEYVVDYEISKILGSEAAQ